MLAHTHVSPVVSVCSHTAIGVYSSVQHQHRLRAVMRCIAGDAAEEEFLDGSLPAHTEGSSIGCGPRQWGSASKAAGGGLHSKQQLA